MERPPGREFQAAPSKRRRIGRVRAANSEGFSEQGLLTYEQRLGRDPRWALSEGSRHFEERRVFDALRKITNRLNGMGIPYAVVGGLALFQHGLRRFTEDVDILVTKDDLRRIHQRREGRRLCHCRRMPRASTFRRTLGRISTTGVPGCGKEASLFRSLPVTIRHALAEQVAHIKHPTRRPFAIVRTDKGYEVGSRDSHGARYGVPTGSRGLADASEAP